MGSLDSHSSSRAPSHIVEDPRRESSTRSSPSTRASNFDHNECASSMAASQDLSPWRTQNDYLHVTYHHDRRFSEPPSPNSTFWPDATWSHRASYEDARQHVQWTPDVPDLPQKPQYYGSYHSDRPLTGPDAVDWQSPPPATYPTRPRFLHHPHSAPANLYYSHTSLYILEDQKLRPSPAFHSPETSYPSTCDQFQPIESPTFADLSSQSDDGYSGWIGTPDFSTPDPEAFVHSVNNHPSPAPAYSQCGSEDYLGMGWQGNSIEVY